MNSLFHLTIVGLVIFLILFIGGLFHIHPAKRFKFSIIISYLTLIGFGYFDNHFDINMLGEWFLVTAMLILVFMVWSVLCWGYTLSMLLALDNLETKSTDEWINVYAQSTNGFNVLTKNRMNILIKLILVNKLTENEYIITKRGSCMASLIYSMAPFVGLRNVSNC